MEKVIKQMLSPKRYEHSIGVANTARQLAQLYGEDADKAELAGIVHDIAKELPKEELLKLCEKGGIAVNEIEAQNPTLLHGPAGAVLIGDYGIDDEDIKNAVRYHTVGRGQMSVLEKIIYLADIIEPSRDFPEVEELRALAQKDLDAAMARCVLYLIGWNMSKGMLIHKNTIDLWNQLVWNKER